MTFRRGMIAATLCAGVALGGTLPSHATDATKHQKIEDLFKLIEIDKAIDQITAQQVVQARSIMKTMVPSGSVTPEVQKDLDAFLEKVVKLTRDAVNWPKLEPQFVDLYAATYSEDEVDGILAFYRSPVGQSMIRKQPELLSKSQAISQAQLAAIQPQLRDAVTEFAREMAARQPKQ